MYDLGSDPEELCNVVDDPAYGEVLRQMRAELARLQERYRDTPYTGPDTPRPDWSTGEQHFSGVPSEST